MDIATKTVTTRVHTAVATTDDLKAVAILAVKGKLGLSDDAVLSTEATVGEDGSISVEVVEAVKGDEPEAKADEAPKADAPAIPMGIGAA